MASVIFIPSICLPRIYFRFDEEYVAGVFGAMFGNDIAGKSCVDHIDFLGRQDRNTGEPYWLCFVHFSKEGVSSTPEIENYVNRINAGEVVNIQYNYPDKWFWKSSKNSKPSGPAFSATDKKKPGPRIMPQADQDQIADTMNRIQQVKNVAEKKVETPPHSVTKEDKPIAKIPNKMNWADDEEEQSTNAGD